MVKSSNIIVGVLSTAFFPLTSFACGISFNILDYGSFFYLFICLLISFTILYSFTLTLRKYFAFVKNNLQASEVLAHSKDISILFLFLVVFSIFSWEISQILTSGFCLNIASPSEEYGVWIIQWAYIIALFVSTFTYILSRKLINKVFVSSKLCVCMLILTIVIELIPIVAFLRLTVFFPETIPDRFKGDIMYQQLNEQLKNEKRIGDFE